MKKARHIHRISHTIYSSHSVSPRQHLYSLVGIPIITVLIIAILSLFLSSPISSTRNFSLGDIFLGTAFTLLRLLISYVIALAVAIPLALLVTRNTLAEKILFPILDVLQSVPVLAFFPIIIIFFLKVNFFEGAAIFILSFTMLWEIVFTLIGGLKVLPDDINSAAKVFGIKGFNFVRRISIPSIVPHVITGSLIGWAEGWNIVIVAEVLHNYIPNGTTRDDLFGIGSIMAQASISGRNDIMIAALIVMIITIAFMNLFIWQKLLHYSEKYKYD